MILSDVFVGIMIKEGIQKTQVTLTKLMRKIRDFGQKQPKWMAQIMDISRKQQFDYEFEFINPSNTTPLSKLLIGFCKTQKSIPT